MEILADYHVHTRFSHGKGTVPEMIAAAHAQGLEEVAISDHGPDHLLGIGIAHLGVLDVIRSQLNQLRSEYPDLKMLLGIEANVTSIAGDIDIPPHWLHRLDVRQVGLHVMVKPHRVVDGVQRTALHFLRGLSTSVRQRSRALNTEALINAVHRHPVDIVTHPGHRLHIDTRALARACAQSGTAMEINSSHHISVEFIEVAATEGAEFVLGSDAHHPARVGDLARAVQLAKAAGLNSRQIRNVR